MPKLIGAWSPDRQTWETPQMDLFSGLSEPYSATWPASGTTRAGWAYELPTWARLTAASESSSSLGLLPTPTAVSYGNNQSPSPGAAVRPSLDSLAPTLLPTPTATNSAGNETNNRGEKLLPGVAATLLPTPQYREGDGRGMSPPATAARRLAEGRRNLDDAISALPLLLPTPMARDIKGAGYGLQEGRPLSEVVLGRLGPLLPTPRASDGPKGSPQQKGSSGDLMLPPVALALHAAQEKLLPTPTANDSKGGRNCTAQRRDPNSTANSGTTLSDWAWLSTGASTPPRSAGGKPCSDVPLPPPRSPELEGSPS